MTHVSQYVQSNASCPKVSISVTSPNAGQFTMPRVQDPNLVLNNGCYPAAYYINAYATPAIMQLNQAALSKQMQNIKKANEEANGQASTANIEKPQEAIPKETKSEQQVQIKDEKPISQVQTNPINAEVKIPKSLVDTLEKIAKNSAKDSAPKMELTDHYVKNLERYLNSQDRKLRIMAGQDVVARLQEDTERKDNPALTNLTNKMLQDPDMSVRNLSLAALEANLITGDDFTKDLLTKMTKTQNEQDSMHANKILLRM